MPLLYSFAVILRVALVMCGLLVLTVRPAPEWVEASYANGLYPQWQHAMYAVTAPLPWSLGDVAVLALVVALVIVPVRTLRSKRPLPRRIAIAALDGAAVLAFALVWFSLSWGWNYDRAPVETRLAYEAGRVTPAAADELRARAIRRLNALAPAAHARGPAGFDESALADAWLPAVQRGGDRWLPRVAPAKPTIFDPFMAATGTTGFINPLTLNVQLASDLLWFERPFTQAHEWSHDAAFAREDEANYFGIVTCLRSPDPAVQYSGWFELFLYLPPLQQYPRSTFSTLVWNDFAALRARNARKVNLTLSAFTWKTYGTYLKSNRVASGVENYNEVTRLVLGIPLDADGLPVAREAISR